MPAEGWLSVVDGVVVLRARPPAHLGLEIAFEAAALMTHARPSPALLDWLSSIDPAAVDVRPRRVACLPRARRAGQRPLVEVPRHARCLGDGRSRSCRKPCATGPQTRSSSIRLRPTDGRRSSGCGPSTRRTPSPPELQQLAHPEWLFLAALIADAVGDRPDGVAVARRLVGRLELGAAAEQQFALLVEDRDLLLAAIRQPDGWGEASVLALASHLDTPERARALFILSGVRTDGLDTLGVRPASRAARARARSARTPGSHRSRREEPGRPPPGTSVTRRRR